MQIEVCLKKNPAASSSEIRDFIFTGSQDSVDLQNVSPNTLSQFIWYQKNKFKENGYCIQRVSGSGRPKNVTGDKKNVKQIVKSFLGKETPGQRTLAKQLDISLWSVTQILKENGIQ